MKRRQLCSALLALACMILGAASIAHASLTLVSGLGTTHVGNLVTNGSFEEGEPS